MHQGITRTARGQQQARRCGSYGVQDQTVYFRHLPFYACMTVQGMDLPPGGCPEPYPRTQGEPGRIELLCGCPCRNKLIACRSVQSRVFRQLKRAATVEQGTAAHQSNFFCSLDSNCRSWLATQRCDRSGLRPAACAEAALPASDRPSLAAAAGVRARTLAWTRARLRCATAHACSPAALWQATASFAALPAMALVDVLQPLLPSQHASTPVLPSLRQPLPAYMPSLPQWPRFQQQAQPDTAPAVQQALSAAPPLPRLDFPQRLTRGVLEGRPSRFIMRVRLGGETVDAYCPTTTRIGGLSAADLLGAEVPSGLVFAARVFCFSGNTGRPTRCGQRL